MKTAVILVTLACFGYASAGIFGGSKIECGSSTSSKAFSLVNPNTPPRICNYRIDAYSSYVCQLRIEFDMNLAQPSVPSAKNDLEYAECIDDYLEVGGYKFCGKEVDQHIYIPFNRTAGEKSVQIRFVSAVRSGGSRLPPIAWDVRVEQLECPKGSPVRSLPIAGRASFTDGWWIAPPGCLQYYPESTGTVQSFNFNNGQGLYPGNLDYAICFKRDIDTEGIELDVESFELGYTVGIGGEIGESCRPEFRNSGLNEDRLVVSDGEIEEDDVNASLFCGTSLEGKRVTSRTPGPIVVVFHSDKIYDPEVPEKGFSFEYSIL